MKHAFRLGLLGAALILPGARAQDILFDFDSAPVHTSLPLALSAGGVTASFSATGQGFSIQPANTMGFAPAGFGGNCLYPNSIYAADLVVAFSQRLSSFSILYAPQELGCDSSARMRATAYLDGVAVGASTTNASAPGTWPSEVLSFASGAEFNRVVMHYDAPPACQDYGPIFMADNMRVVLAPPPIRVAASWLAGGVFQFNFTNTPGRSFTVWSAPNAVLPLSNWTAASALKELSPGSFQFTDSQPATNGSRFYRVSSP